MQPKLLGSFVTPQNCNCLLSVPPRDGNSGGGDSDNGRSDGRPTLLVGMYEHVAGASGGEDGGVGDSHCGGILSATLDLPEDTDGAGAPPAAHRVASLRAAALAQQRHEEKGAGGGQFPGVFDMALVTTSLFSAVHEPVLVLSRTDGAVQLCPVYGGDDGGEGDAWRCVIPVGSEMLTSSCAFVDQLARPLLICTSHKGGAHVLDLERTMAGAARGAAAPSEAEGRRALPSVVASWTAHEFDAWTCAPHVGGGGGGGAGALLWTGGDDGYLRGWDLRALRESCAAAADEDGRGGDGVAAAQLAKRHDAGVVSITTGDVVPELGPHLILAGSYDEHIYVYDVRQLKHAVSQVHVGGGAWRCRRLSPPKAKGEGSGSGLIRFAVAAMQGGVALIGVDPATGDAAREAPENFASEGDNPLIYDVAEVASGRCDGGTVVAACSFYEKVVSLWHC